MKELRAFTQLGHKFNLWHWRWAEILKLFSGRVRHLNLSGIRAYVYGCAARCVPAPGGHRLPGIHLSSLQLAGRVLQQPCQVAPCTCHGWQPQPSCICMPESGCTSWPRLSAYESIGKKKLREKGQVFSLLWTSLGPWPFLPPAGLRSMI